MNYVIGMGVIAVLGLVGYYATQDQMADDSQIVVTEEAIDAGSADTISESADAQERSEVAPGVYTVAVDASTVRWAGKKPLVEGYINSGSLALESGTITVLDGAATGEFTIDMQTLSVSDTPAKPGSESTLESHLQGERWFDVATYPAATFAITNVDRRADSAETFVYDITGLLTMKGETGELSFPAEIFQTTTGQVVVRAETEFDRTKWGITSGSGSFFDNLADNVIDDMVALSFELVAE